MSNNLADVWQQVENLLNQNISIVPVRDKDEVYNGKIFGAKTPYKEWKRYQYEIIDRNTLWELMNLKNTTAIAMICGSISGNLEVIDFDTKYKPGIDAIVINAINDLFPDILAKMRPHKTPSGGTHLVYRIADHEVPPSTHLANRPATVEEIEGTPNKKKFRTFIETRGTGGMATAPPSLGYTVRKDVPLQAITWEERCAVIELCKAYNEFYPEDKPYTPPKTEINYYDENPFAHYNRSVDPVELFTEYGWVYVRRSGDYIWFTRPGGRRGEVHAGFNTNTHTYRVWGTKADLESERSYTPSTILAHYRFNGDKSLTYAHLVQSGYGRIKPSMERTIARKRALQGQPMPANASATAVAEYQTQVEQLTTAHPHGIYWEPDTENDNKIIISRLAFKEVATNIGFRLYEADVVQIQEQFIYKRDLRYFFDTMRNYIKEEDADLYEQIYNATQSFLEKHGKFESTQLDFIDQSTILNDTRTACYKFYKNGYVHITPQGYELLDYATLTDKLIWYEKIQQREFIYRTGRYMDSNSGDASATESDTCSGGLYTDFLRLSCDLENNRDHIMKTIGWLAHDYKDASMAYIVVLVERCTDPKDGGGSGKNLFCELLKHTTTYGSMAAGQKRNFDGTTLLQAWKGEKIYALSDVKKDFEFEILKEPAGGKAIDKKLFKDEKNLDIKDVPKFIVLTNFSYEVSDGGLRRRIIPIEFTNFFTECGGVDKYYSKMFPDDWADDDWAEYDNFIAQSVFMWMRGGLKLKPIELSGTGWEKQFAQTFGQYTYDFISHFWPQWMGTFVSNAEFKKQMDDYFTDLGIGQFDKYRPKMPKINKALDEWCKHFGCTLIKDTVKRTDPFNTERGKEFIIEDAPF